MLEACLYKIAKELNENKVTWALGASMLLYYKGIKTRPNDIDLIIDTKDVEKADRILCRMGTKLPANPHLDYGTRYFYEYVIDRVDIDVMSGFIIKRKDKAYEYKIRPDSFDKFDIRDTACYLCPIEDWYVLYCLMPDREEKVRMLEQYFSKTLPDEKNLEYWLSEDIPDEVKIKLKSFYP